MDIYQRLGVLEPEPSAIKLVLTHEQRGKGRLKVIAQDGAEVRIFLERGKPLQIGECLRSQCGKTIQIDGAVEPVLTACCNDWLTFSRACYHLGNRHVKIQINDLRLAITPDHVLEEMLQSLGLTTCHEQAVFTPESGAYSHGHHHH